MEVYKSSYSNREIAAGKEKERFVMILKSFQLVICNLIFPSVVNVASLVVLISLIIYGFLITFYLVSYNHIDLLCGFFFPFFSPSFLGFLLKVEAGLLSLSPSVAAQADTFVCLVVMLFLHIAAVEKCLLLGH